MFTGIIQAKGKVASLQHAGSDARLKIDTGKLDLSDADLGDSIAVNGVCLTAVQLDNHAFEADVSGETLKRSSLGDLRAGSDVNLELAMLPTTRFGGHIVSGHVDGLAELIDISEQGQSIRMRFRLPDELGRYVAEKGSICIDGVSLTVNAVEGAEFEVNLVPHTMKETILDSYRAGSRVNIEVDIIARYLERMLQYDAQMDSSTNEDALVEKIRDMFDD
jgi:riboflavin synthase